MISKELADQDVVLTARRLALLYDHFSRVLIDELGEEKGKELIQKTIKNYGDECGLEVRES